MTLRLTTVGRRGDLGGAGGVTVWRLPQSGIAYISGAWQGYPQDATQVTSKSTPGYAKAAADSAGKIAAGDSSLAASRRAQGPSAQAGPDTSSFGSAKGSRL